MEINNLVILFSMFFLLLGCEPDEAEDIDRNRLLGGWIAEDAEVKSSQSIYFVNILDGNLDSTTILIENFHNLGNTNYVEAKVFGTYIEINGFVTQDRFVIEGIGEPNANYSQINWEYSVDILDGNPKDYTATYSKQ